MDELSELIQKHKEVRHKIEKLKEECGCGYLELETGESPAYSQGAEHRDGRPRLYR